MQMAHFSSNIPRPMEITVEGKQVSTNYGMPMFCERVLRIPEECITLLCHQRALLHMEDNFVKSAEWPFLALSSSTTAAVVPFNEQDQDGFMPDFVIIIPRWFFTASPT
jgi:hypothetical protein